MADPTYALMLVGYTMWNGIVSPPAMHELGNYGKMDDCKKAASDYSKLKERKDEAARNKELHWTLICVVKPPAG